jgi:NACHT domain
VSDHALPESDHDEAILAKLKVPDLECGPHTAECMPGTRQDILESINTWTTDFDAPNILWLKGYPGVGKSAIASSLVEQLRTAGRLGSQFFFQRQRSNVMTTNALWRTVAYELAREYPAIRKHLVAALEADESIPTAFNVDRVFRQLIQDSLLASQEIPVERLPVIVVDALDECGGLEGEHSSHRKKLVRTLQLWSGLPLKFKLIVTSRDESDIMGIFLRTSHHPIEISAGRTVEAQSSEDIQTFLTHRFQQIALQHPGSLSPDWPGPAVIIQMASTAAGLFIWAETVIRFVNLGQPKERLGLVLEGDGTGDMATLYEQILRSSFSSLRDHELEDLCSVMGTVILAKAPLSFSTLASLLSMDDSTVEQICIGLQSVLDSQGVLTFHHQSFIDFLIDPARSTSKLFVRRKQETRNLTIACLTVMKNGLQFNICDLRTSYLRNAAVPDLASRVKACISPHLSYSTLFWSGHLAETNFDLGVFEDLQYFMDNQFLFWLEVLSLIKQVNVASSMLLMLIDWLKVRF